MSSGSKISKHSPLQLSALTDSGRFSIRSTITLPILSLRGSHFCPQSGPGRFWPRASPQLDIPTVRLPRSNPCFPRISQSTRDASPCEEPCWPGRGPISMEISNFRTGSRKDDSSAHTHVPPMDSHFIMELSRYRLEVAQTGRQPSRVRYTPS